jgi:hypothetical protein
MSTEFTEKECEMLYSAVYQIDEILCDDRKGVALTKYICEVKDGQTYWNGSEVVPVPDKYVGFWMMENPSDLEHSTLQEAFRKESWVRCVQKEVVRFEWVQQ